MRRVYLASCLALLAAQSGSARGQTFSGAGPTRPLILPMPAGAAPVPKVEPVPVAEPPAEVLRALPLTRGGWRLEGESANLDWPLYVTDAQARGRTRFRLGYASDVSVMPEASTLTLSINDTLVGSAEIRASARGRAIEIDLPGDVLKRGFNAVRIAASQRHRTDCSVAATYELWTEIDPARTGLVVPADLALPTAVADLAALGLRADGALPIRAVLAGKLRTVEVERMVRAAQIVALAGAFEHPVVDFGPPVGGTAGLNLIVATTADLPASLGIERGVGPRTILLSPEAERGATLVVTGDTDAEVEEALSNLARAPRPGTASGLRAVAALAGYRIDGDERLPLRALGLGSTEFTGRTLRLRTDLNLPADFLPAGAAKLELDLAGGYAAGLTQDARIVVDVNGRNAGTVLLAKPEGGMFLHNPVGIPVGMLRPGANRIDIVAQVPGHADAGCGARIAPKPEKRFLFLDTSTLTVPALARVGRLPDLAPLAAGAFPFGHEGRPRPVLYVPAPDRATMGAAMTMAAHLAVAAGRPIDFAFAIAAPVDGVADVLAVGPSRSLDAATLRRAGLDPDYVQTAWPVARSAPEAGFTNRRRGVRPSVCELAPAGSGQGSSNQIPAPADAAPARPDSVAAAGESAIEDGARQLYTSWNGRVGNPSGWSRSALDGVSERTARFWAMLGSHSRDVSEGLSTAFAGKGDGAKPDLRRNAVLLVAQGLDGSAGGVTTVVTASDAAGLSASVACLGIPEVWSSLGGRTAVLDGVTGRFVVGDEAGNTLVATKPTSLGNLRLISAAWLSLHPAGFFALVLLVVGWLSVSTDRLVRTIGRKP